MLSRVCPMLSSQDRPQSRAEMNATTPSLGPSSRSMLAGQSSQPWEIVEWPEKSANCLSAKKRKNRGVRRSGKSKHERHLSVSRTTWRTKLKASTVLSWIPSKERISSATRWSRRRRQKPSSIRPDQSEPGSKRSPGPHQGRWKGSNPIECCTATSAAHQEQAKAK
jgi:hypothetical protein